LQVRGRAAVSAGVRLSVAVSGAARAVTWPCDVRRDTAAACGRAHAAYFADFAKQQWRHLTGQRREAALAAMTADIDNLRLASCHWVGERDRVQLNKLVDSLWLLYDARGWYQDTIGLTNDLLMSWRQRRPPRSGRQITLRISLARALMATKGYTREVEEAHATALQPFQGARVAATVPRAPEPGQLLHRPVRIRQGARMGREILQLAERQNDDGMLIEGIWSSPSAPPCPWKASRSGWSTWTRRSPSSGPGPCRCGRGGYPTLRRQGRRGTRP
jgi:hypothetical protein